MTNKVGDTLTVTRGRDSTVAIAFTAGSVIELRLVAQMLRDLDWRTARGAVNGVASLDASGLIPDAQIPASITRDSELTAGLATKQNTLGFTPVQQGTGVGQQTNTVKIGWSAGDKLKVTVDTFDQGNVAMETWVNSLRGAANGVATLDASTKIPVAQIPALSYLPLSGGTLTGTLTLSGAAQVNAGGSVAGSSIISNQDFRSTGPAVVLGVGTPGTVYLRPNGTGSASGEATLSSAGVMTAVNFTATSDRSLKDQISPQVVREHLADQLNFKRWVWKDSQLVGVGVIAQDLQAVAPEYVHTAGNGLLSVDYSLLALESVIGLAARVRALEAASTTNR